MNPSISTSSPAARAARLLLSASRSSILLTRRELLSIRHLSSFSTTTQLADEIRKKMFVFEDILLLDDRAIQRVLRDVDNSDLAIALKGSNEEVQNAIFSR